MSHKKPTVSFSNLDMAAEGNRDFPKKALPRLKERFSLGGYDPEAFAYSFMKTKPHEWKDENALKDELLRIFQREKETMEEHYLGKIQNLLLGFKEKKEEWEAVVKGEREHLEQQFDNEKKSYRAIIAAEINEIKEEHDKQMKELELKHAKNIEDIRTESKAEKEQFQTEIKQSFDMQARLIESEHEAKIKLMNQEHQDQLKAEQNQSSIKLEGQINELRVNHAHEIALYKEKWDCMKESLEARAKEDKDRLEKQSKAKIEMLEDRLQKEANFRADVERALNQEKANLQAMNLVLKEELTRHKEEMERLRRVPYSSENSAGIQGFSSRSDLPPKLREDFDSLLKEYKEEFKEKLRIEKEFMDEKLELEKDRIRESYTRDKADLERRLADDKYRMERDLDRSRDEIEREVERKIKTKHLQETLTDQQQKLNETAKRLEDEGRKRQIDWDRDNEKEKIHTMINDIKKENEGLKVKLNALEDNNNTLKQLKEEGQQEISRLKTAIGDLKHLIQNHKQDGDRQSFPIVYANLDRENRAEGTKHITSDPQIEYEKRRLQDLRKELEKQERDYRERKTVEEATKNAEQHNKRHLDEVMREKRGLQDAVRTLENKITSMQNDMERLKKPSPIHYAEPTSTIHSPQRGASPVNLALSYEHLDRIDGLLKEKSKLVNTVSDYEGDYRSLEKENAILDKKVKDMEWKIEKLQDKLEKEKKNNGKLENELQSYKSKLDYAKEELESTRNKLKEGEEKVVRLKESIERKDEDINKLKIIQTKLEESIASLQNTPSRNNPKTVPSAYSVSSRNATVDDDDPWKEAFKSRVMPISSEPRTDVNGDFSGELEHILALERDKTDLQRRLAETRGVLENYVGRLDAETRRSEERPDSYSRNRESVTGKHTTLADIVTHVSSSDEKRSNAIENWKLLQQKMQLQRLIERLTKIQ